MGLYEFNDKQLDRLSEFLSNASLLMVATLVLPNIFGITQPKMEELIPGLIISFLLLLGSLFLIRRSYD